MVAEVSRYLGRKVADTKSHVSRPYALKLTQPVIGSITCNTFYHFPISLTWHSSPETIGARLPTPNLTEPRISCNESKYNQLTRSHLGKLKTFSFAQSTTPGWSNWPACPR
jgi:hypothetical protein